MENYNIGLCFIADNFVGLEKLKVEGIGSCQFQSILQNMNASIIEKNKKNEKYNLQNLSIKNFTSIEYKLNMMKLNKLKKLKMKNGDFINTMVISKLFIENNANLVSLTLDNINMTDLGFESIL